MIGSLVGYRKWTYTDKRTGELKDGLALHLNNDEPANSEHVGIEAANISMFGSRVRVPDLVLGQRYVVDVDSRNNVTAIIPLATA